MMIIVKSVCGGGGGGRVAEGHRREYKLKPWTNGDVTILCSSSRH